MENTETTQATSQKQKKPLIKRIFKKLASTFAFSRLPMIIILILFQAALYFIIFNIIDDYSREYTLLRAFGILITSIIIYNYNMDSSVKLTWMLIVAMLPLTGAAFFIYTRLGLSFWDIRLKILNTIRRTMNFLPVDVEVAKELYFEDPTTFNLFIYSNNTGCFPIYKDSDITFFPLGEDKFDDMLNELKKAQSYIFLEYFIIEEGIMWNSILDILVEKVKEGVEVRLMYDGMCEITTLSFDYKDKMKELGIKCKPFFPITPLMSTKYNYRDHRKILVIDGIVAYNGGVNLADEYINKKERFGHWKDTAVKIYGTAAQSFTLMFLQMWNIDAAEYYDDSNYYPYIPYLEPSNNLELMMTNYFNEDAISELYRIEDTYTPDDFPKGYVLPFADYPTDGDKVGKKFFLEILNHAQKFVYIMTPYLILDDELLETLKYTAQRFVDVRIILPGIPDKKGAYALAKSHYRILNDYGVKIYEYTPGFVHAKIIVSDMKRAIVGTINFDYRSLYHHFECATYMYRSPAIIDIVDDFKQTQKKCRRIDEDAIKNEKLSYKILGKVLKLVAPLM